MSSLRFNFHAAVYLILKKENKILLMRRFNTGWMDGMYSLPAGHVDGDETVLSSAIREAKEELDIDILPEDLSIVHLMHRKSDYEYFDFFIEVKNYRGELKNNEENKCDEINWFSVDSLPHNILDHIKKVFNYIHEGKAFSSFGFESF